MLNQTHITLPQPAAAKPCGPPQISSELDRRIAGTRDLARSAGLDVPFVSLRKMPDGVERLSTEKSDWVITKLADDPAVKRYKKFYMTSRVQTDLSRIRDAGLSFDEIAVAHELPKGTLKPWRRVTADMLMPPRREVTIATGNRWANAAEEVHADALPFAIGAGAVLIGGLAAAANTVKDAGADAIRFTTQAYAEARKGRVNRPTRSSEGGFIGFLLDPIVFGILREEGDEQAAWFYLTHWTWGEEE